MKRSTIKQQIAAIGRARARVFVRGYKADDQTLNDAASTLASVGLMLGNPKTLRARIVAVIETQPTVELTADAILDVLGVRVPNKPKTFIIVKGKRREVEIKHITKTGVMYGLK